ncbi:hypothetical protein K450DRAFT_249904 [Umbelopsis ramanniana AG]|uniref:Probable beta-glucosidase G n=1 Tax=Umbelopsis ramanniana AG TaxID=1314678 RepID=A0AAD5HD84_UMBRA|nr:uncharacterized protein K450DRAFT_249904 [Umbelopsis ramanniana AG]KAI8577923.1 hypothetical protein K450DRAFT_249904 [Umbelopsis ramanniana AG]
MKVAYIWFTVAIACIFTEAADEISWSEAYAKAKVAVSKLADKEKVTLGTGTGSGICVGNTAAISKIGWPGLCLQDSPLAVRLAYNVTGGISGINTAATFDRDLVRQRAEDMGDEFRGKGVNIQLGPDVNMARIPESGRNWEGFGEDPYLTGIMGGITVAGVQSKGVIATAKHFIMNEQETDRTTSSSEADDRTIHEIYAWPFARAVEAGVASVMCSYNKVNGTYACENDETLNTILKGELNFQGFVQSDWGATHSGAKSANAGLDMDMPGPDAYWGPTLTSQVEAGKVSEDRLNDMATRILAAWYKLGQDSGYPNITVNDNKVDVQGNHKQTIREIGAASAVLLKNINQTLPLSNPKSIGIIGNDADSANYGPLGCTELPCLSGTIASGFGSGGSYYPYIISPAAGIQARAPNSTQVKTSLSNLNIIAAIQIAKSVDYPIVFVNADAGEAFDRISLNVDTFGNELIEAIAKHNPNTIVVIHAAGPVLMPWVNNVKAIVYAGLPGQENGNSIADVLFGDVNPSGRLPYTLAKQSSDYPAHSTLSPNVNYSEGLLIGYRWFDAKNITPLYEFGFGLSYTNFSYQNLKITTTPSKVTVKAQIKNTGQVYGAEVPQLYIGFPKSAQEPPKILRGFDKIKLQPGHTKTVSFVVDVARELSVWDTPSKSWKIVNGKFDAYVGASSRDIRLHGSFSI